MGNSESLNSFFKDLSDDKYVSLNIMISEEYDEDDVRYFAVNYDPQLPIRVSSDTLDAAQIQATEAIKYYLLGEAEDRGVDINYENIRIELCYEI